MSRRRRAAQGQVGVSADLAVDGAYTEHTRVAASTTGPARLPSDRFGLGSGTLTRGEWEAAHTAAYG